MAALKTYTLDAAYSVFEEERLGSIETISRFSKNLSPFMGLSRLPRQLNECQITLCLVADRDCLASHERGLFINQERSICNITIHYF